MQKMMRRVKGYGEENEKESGKFVYFVYNISSYNIQQHKRQRTHKHQIAAVPLKDMSLCSLFLP